MPIRRALAATALAATLASCSGSSEAPKPAAPTTVTTSAPTTTTRPMSKDEIEIRAVAEAWYRASIRLAMHPDPDDPALKKYLTGDLLARYQALWRQRQAEGISGRPASPSQAFHRVDRVEVTGNAAVLAECELDDGVLYDAKDDVVDDEVFTSELATKARRVAGIWKLSARSGDELKGVVGCALG